jgi:hypothetical protein
MAVSGTPCNQERLVKLLGLEPTVLQAPRHHPDQRCAGISKNRGV